jgi:L-lactate dehydrogenase complex protein LldG
MATVSLIDTFMTALGRRRATGELVDKSGSAVACLGQLGVWGVQRALIPSDPWLDELGVAEAIASAGIEVLRWPTDRGWRDLLGLTGPPTCAITLPACAVAQRGTLVIEGSPAHGRSLDAVGWWHLSLLPSERIVPTLVDALRLTYAGGTAPSGVSLVSGPSRTSDVEKITTYGAHGALAEHVLVVR